MGLRSAGVSLDQQEGLGGSFCLAYSRVLSPSLAGFRRRGALGRVLNLFAHKNKYGRDYDAPTPSAENPSQALRDSYFVTIGSSTWEGKFLER